MNPDYWVKALEIISRITNPITASVIAIAALGIPLYGIVKEKNRRIAWLLGAGVIVLGLSQIVAFTVLKLQDIYHVTVTVLGTDSQPVKEAEVTAVGERKQTDGGWEFDIPRQSVPTDGSIIFFASAKNSYLAGNSTIRLAGNYFPHLKIQLEPLPPVIVRGVVELPNGSSVSGARVSVVGYSDQTTTDQMGNFALPSHAADGQTITIRAEKGDLEAQYLGPAGKPFTMIMRRQ
jgi:hypothetical protein